ncbi:RE1 [Symbiodinium sp. CCMP2592]|nr:RE1 [Symbiodinium sp. CCMP2592]
MAPKTASQLRHLLFEHGEEAPRQWSKVELLQRVEEVTGTDYTKPQKKEKSEYKTYVNPNWTIAQLQKEALSVIYGKANPDPTDLVGFGRHSQLTYEKLKEGHEQYCAWVVQTAREGQCNPRLRRLAGWLANDVTVVQRAQAEFMTMTKMTDKSEVAGYPAEPTTPRQEVPAPRGKGSGRRGSRSSHAQMDEDSDTVTVGTEMLANLVQTIESLKVEVATLKGERPRKKAVADEGDSTPSMAGYSMARRARQLEQWGSEVIPQIFESLVVDDRKVLLEVVSSSPSILSATIQSVLGRPEAASQCGKHDRCMCGYTQLVKRFLLYNECEYFGRMSEVWNVFGERGTGEAFMNDEQVQDVEQQAKDSLNQKDFRDLRVVYVTLGVYAYYGLTQKTRNPDVTGRMIQRPGDLPDDQVVENASEEFARAARARAEAEKALCDWQAQQRINRAMNSRSRPCATYSPGDLVYFWRTQESGQGRKSPGSKHGRFLGPARILATEGRKESDGSLRPGSSVWLVRGRSLMKCSPEQLRHASAREEHLEALASKTSEGGTPWTFRKVAEEIGGNRYEDISGEVPLESEWVRAQDPEQEDQPQRFATPRHRVRGKRGEPEAATDMHDALNEEPSTPSAPSRAQRPRTVQHWPGGALCAEGWWDQVPEAHFGEHCSYWAEENAAVEVAIDMPTSKRGIEQASRNLCGYFASALKRRAVEMSEKRLSEGERQCFQEAKAIEVKNFVASRAFEALPPGMKPDRSQAMGMRWLLTWKTRDDGSQKAKARAVLLGYQDPSYAHRSTTSPVMTRQTRQMVLQLALNRKWSVYKGDVSGAFLQGREYPETLLCIPCDEICEAMGLQGGSVVRMRKACYGLVDAPLEWYRTVAEYFEAQGLTRLWSDACAWVFRKDGQVKGIISGHVDDFLFSGDEEDAEWQRIIRNIKERFKWGDWDKDVFMQCGVQVTRGPGQFRLSQPNYVEGIPEIPLNSSRRKQEKEDTTPYEKSQLRGLLGALSWHAQQVAPHLSADVSLMLSEVSKSKVSLINRANRLLSQVRARKDHAMIIHAFNESEELGAFAWVDAGSQNRPDGSSTQGILIGLAPVSMLQGEVGQVSLMSWHSNKIDRACRSPGASETQAAISGEDLLYFARYQWSEICFGELDVMDPDSCVRKVQGTLITDSRNVYDKLHTEVLSMKGAERKSNIELLSVKEAQQRTQLHVRWVHSEAQLANSLTKMHGGHELELYYRMGHAWRIVEDPNMKSARRRKAEGLPPLGNVPNEGDEPAHTGEPDSEEICSYLIQDHMYLF